MSEQHKIKNISDLRLETAKARKSIENKEKDLSGDYHRIIESVTPANIITGIISKLVTSAPALYTAYSIAQSVFGRKKKSEKD
jgi:hypothetical protein